MERPDVIGQPLECGCHYAYVKVPVSFYGSIRIAPRRRRIMCEFHKANPPSHRKKSSKSNPYGPKLG